MLQTRSSITLVAVTNTVAGGSIVQISNSGGLYAMQSGPWTVGISNSAGWVVSIANTIAGGSLVSINNSAGWIVNVANTSPLVQVQNSAGWIVNVANTGGSVVVSNTQTAINIINSAGWIINQANTVGNINIINSAGWATYALDSAAVGSVVTAIASTVGTVTLAASQTKRVALSIYNASANPLFMKLGASATTASYSLMMVASGYYELPRPIYNGIVTGIWQTANGSAYISETT